MTWSWGDDVAPPEAAVPICMRGDLVAAKDAAVDALREARQRDPSPNLGDDAAATQAELAQRIRDLEEQCAQAVVTFRFRALPRKQRSDLQAEHPPTEDQQQQARDEGLTASWNPDTFPPALVAASCVEPAGITVEAAQRAYETWAEGQWAPLWRACTAANFGGADPGPKSAIASAVLRGSERN